MPEYIENGEIVHEGRLIIDGVPVPTQEQSGTLFSPTESKEFKSVEPGHDDPQEATQSFIPDFATVWPSNTRTAPVDPWAWLYRGPAKDTPSAEPMHSNMPPVTPEYVTPKKMSVRRKVAAGIAVTLSTLSMGALIHNISQPLNYHPTKAVPLPRQTPSTIESTASTTPTPSTTKWVEVISASPAAKPSDFPSIGILFSPSAEPSQPTETASVEPTESATASPTPEPTPTESPSVSVTPSPEQTPTPSASATETASSTPEPAPSETEPQPSIAISLNTDNPDSGANVISLQGRADVLDLAKRLACEGCKYTTLPDIQNDPIALELPIFFDPKVFAPSALETVHASLQGQLIPGFEIPGVSEHGFSVARLKKIDTNRTIVFINARVPSPDSSRSVQNFFYTQKLKEYVSALQNSEVQAIVINGELTANGKGRRGSSARMLNKLGFEVQAANAQHTRQTYIWTSGEVVQLG